MDNLNYLIAAYSSVWLVLGFYIFTLIRRNHNLAEQLKVLEDRVKSLEAKRR